MIGLDLSEGLSISMKILKKKKGNNKDTYKGKSYFTTKVTHFEWKKKLYLRLSNSIGV